MINITPIGCPSVQRVAYIIYFDKVTRDSLCIGKFIEQENDAGEVQYLFVMDWNVITDDLVEILTVPGIDLTLHSDVYIRSYQIPYFLERCVIQRGRGDFEYYQKLMQMDYVDEFEFMLRSRGITHHSNCYVGRTPTDFCDMMRAMHDREYAASILPNLNVSPENEFHAISEMQC